MGNEARKPNSDVADKLAGGSLEAFGCRVRSEAQTPVVTGAALIQNRQRYGLSERPRQQSVEVSRHQDNIKGKVIPSSLPVPVQIDLGGHFVAAASGVKWRAAQARWLTFGLGFPPVPEVVDLPDQSAVIGCRLELLQVLLVAIELSGMEIQETRVMLQILLQGS